MEQNQTVLHPSEAAVPESHSASEFIKEQWEKERLQMEEARREEALRLAMIDLIPAVGQLIRDAAAQLVIKRGQSGAFAQDIAADDVVWRLGEFLVLANINRHEMGEEITLGHQLTPQHAAEFFEVEFTPNGTAYCPKSEVQP